VQAPSLRSGVYLSWQIMGHALLKTDLRIPEFRTPTAEYFRRDAASPIRLEMHRGRVYAMAGAKKRHNQICQNIAFALRGRLPKGCSVYQENVKLEVAEDETYYYPDVVVECSPPMADEYVVRHPSLVAEVISESTQRTDENEKLDAYLDLPTLQHLLLIYPAEARIAHYFRRLEGEWAVEVLGGEDAVLKLKALDIEVPVAEVFAM